MTAGDRNRKHENVIRIAAKLFVSAPNITTLSITVQEKLQISQGCLPSACHLCWSYKES